MLRTPHLIAALVLALPLVASAQGEPTTDEAPREAPPAEALPAEEEPEPLPPPPEVEPGYIVGRVTDAATSEGLPAAYIQIKGGNDAYQTLAR
jgi:hypothetical protein